MSLIDREYMKRECESTTKNRFKSSDAYAHSNSYSRRELSSEGSFRSPLQSESNGERFSCIRCGRSYSTKEAAAICFRSHSYKPVAGDGTTSILYKIKKYMYKIKKSIINIVSKR